MNLKKRLRLVSIALSVLNLVTMCYMSVGCKTEKEVVEENSFTDGYFKYYYIKETGDYAIVGDGDVPYPETLVVPAYYKDKEISNIAYNVYVGVIIGTEYLGPSLRGVETVYFPYTSSEFFPFYDRYCSVPLADEELGKPQKYFAVCNRDDDYYYGVPDGGNYPKILYCTSILYNKHYYEKNDKYAYVHEWRNGNGRYQIANTAYMFNYEEAPNEGYFFINDFERGGLIENTPYEPLREGYIFGGWYKDSTCTDVWDFSMDKLPEAEYDEEGYVTEFVETKLYAKWIKEEK